jgi:hypothetical protein
MERALKFRWMLPIGRYARALRAGPKLIDELSMNCECRWIRNESNRSDRIVDPEVGNHLAG